ncbi:MAG: putative 2OG-Fe(II) oxygenase [Pseudomonadota bacterium]
MQTAQKIAAEPPLSFRVDLEPPRMFTVKEELAITRTAVARRPDSTEMRYRLAHHLYTLDQFDETVDVLRQIDGEVDDFRFPHMLGAALMARENHEDTLEAVRMASRAIDLSSNHLERARALASLGKAQIRLERFDEGRKTLIAALDASIHNKDAYKRLAMLDFQMERTEAALEHADEMVAKGITHARVLGVRPLALAKLGRTEEAREAFGFDAYLHETILPAPPGWDSIEAFNRDLAAELLAHPGIRYERYGVASAHTWRIDEPCLGRSKMMPVLQRLLQNEIAAYVSRLGDSGDAWMRGRKPSGFLHHWSVITDGDGFEEWHVHQNGWVSGAYYVDIPDFIVQGEDNGGCVAFGLPEGIVGDAAHEAFGTRVFRPRSGLVMMFPSHSFHRTYAHRGNKRRICVAFDVAAHEQLA